MIVRFGSLELQVLGGKWTSLSNDPVGLSLARVLNLNGRVVQPPGWEPDADHWLAVAAARRFRGRVLTPVRADWPKAIY